MATLAEKLRAKLKKETSSGLAARLRDKSRNELNRQMRPAKAKMKRKKKGY